jgi:uncharacterized protein YbaR (Trm112 family)
MHIQLTDITSCPRCGPGFGLILLVDEMVERRVRRGALACANCRERYQVREGTVDFTLGANADFGAPIEQPAALRLVALAGVTEPPARLLVAGPAAEHAAAIAAMLPCEVVAATGDASAPAQSGVSRIAITGRLPFFDARFAGVVLTGSAADELLSEGARMVAAGGRLVLEPAPADARARVQAAGLETLAAEGATLVAARG